MPRYRSQPNGTTAVSALLQVDLGFRSPRLDAAKGTAAALSSDCPALIASCPSMSTAQDPHPLDRRQNVPESPIPSSKAHVRVHKWMHCREPEPQVTSRFLRARHRSSRRHA
jgi:hypothetical protein